MTTNPNQGAIMPDPTNPTPEATTTPDTTPDTIVEAPAADDMSFIDEALAAADSMEPEAEIAAPEPEPETTPAGEEPAATEDPEAPAEPAAEEGPAEGEEPAAAEDEPEAGEKDEAVEKEMADLKIDKPNAQKRFRELSAENARLRPLESKAQSWDTFETMVKSTQASPEQFGDALNVLRAINSDDPQMLSAVYDKMSRELAAIGKRIGREAPGYDPLADHPDLKQKVEDQDISRADALEIVKHRATGQIQETRTAREQQSAQQKQEFQRAMYRAQQDLDAIGDELSKIDPYYAEKAKMLVPILKPTFAEVHPSRWPAMFRKAYVDLVYTPPTAAVAPPAAPAASRPAPLRNQPLRPTGAAAATISTTGGSDLDVIEQAIAAANRANGVAT